MPHQCLKCGQAFAEGSREILKGCSACSGTRFFFTREPLGQAEREELLRKSSRELKQLLHDLADAGGPRPREAEAAGFRGTEARANGPAKDVNGKEWVPIDAKNLRAMLNEAMAEEKAARAVAMPSVRDYVEKKALELGPIPWPGRAASAPSEPEPDPSTEGRIVPKKLSATYKHKDELRFDEKRGWGEIPPAKPKQAGKAAAPPPQAPPPKAGPKATPALRPNPPLLPEAPATPTPLGPDLSKWQEGKAPEVVSIRSPGQYEIDVEGLLSHQPIVVAKDGTYMIHLPSVFEELEKRSKK